ncbi:MAG TPA: class I SAM-dependent methyltransferase [Pseudobdellovibrionaceae bacterium]|nr:class I SAM-dependent methyltransferase [Pseudobdellovibrionaceae bacterium]
MLGRIGQKLFVALRNLLDGGLIFAAKRQIIRRYQPLFQISKSTEPTADLGDRACADRWQVMASGLPKSSYSLLDVGSQLGFFTLSAARENPSGLCLGLERVWTYAAVAEALRNRAKLPNAQFAGLELNPKSVRGLPQFDVIICMSVFHHWVLDWGAEAAITQLRELFARGRIVYFETGQCEEVDQNFAAQLGFMKPESELWIRSELLRAGFQKITVLGDFPTHLGPHKRRLYRAEREA